MQILTIKQMIDLKQKTNTTNCHHTNAKSYITSDNRKKAEMTAERNRTYNDLDEKEKEDLNLNPILEEESCLLSLSENSL